MNIRAHLFNNHDNDFSQKILKMEDVKLLSFIANSLQVLLNNELSQIIHSLEIFVDTIYHDIENLTE